MMATLAAVVVVGQQATARTIVAASLVAMGLGLLAFRSHRSGTLAATGLALVVGATIAAYSVVDARAVREGPHRSRLAGTLGIEGVLMAATAGFDVPACVRRSARARRSRSAASVRTPSCCSRSGSRRWVASRRCARSRS